MALGSDDNYKILISTDSDTKGVKATESALDRLRGATDGSHTSFLKMSAAVAAGQAAFAIASNAIGKVAGFLGDSVTAANEAQAAQKQLEHAVVGVSHATQQQLKDTEALADALEKKGVLDGDNIKLGLAQLSTFGLSNKAVQGLAGSLSDLAVNQFGVNASGEQLSDTANMIAKALNGQFGVLEKSGIRFSDAQKNMIAYGTEMQKVKAINEGFAQNLKYTNDVALTTTEGKMAKLKVSFENVQEAIGASVVRGIEPLMAKLSTFVSSDKFQQWVEKLTKWFDENFPKAINYLTNTALPALKKIFEDVWPVVKTVAGVFADFVIFMSEHMWVFWGIVTALTAIKVALGIQSLIVGVSAAFSGLATAATVAGGAMVAALPVALVAAGVAGIIWQLSRIVSTYHDIQRLDAETNRIINSTNANIDRMFNNSKNTLQSIYKIQQSVGYSGQNKVYFNGNTYMTGYAAGTTNATAGTHLVGENGPELVNFRGGEKVMPADKTAKALGGNTVNYNAPIYLQTAEATREFFDILDRNSVLTGKGLGIA